MSEEEQLQAEFSKYDSKAKGHMNELDVSDLLTSVQARAVACVIPGRFLIYACAYRDQGFATTTNDDCAHGLIESFGEDGKVKLAGFKSMWAHLGGVFDASVETRESASTAAVDAIPLDHPLRDSFLKYDLNRDGHLSPLEVSV